ncbi:uncharacterized protein BXZ73DRAFT_76825 [Epithele typhae]|uniref:uncharacterized protein n=1 Tax=Epithele typhae TaxID=378194 RepID=UPI002007951C|nr:uncharacterized protein BXZ73DRAFT_76825 [Epithele typhae]KAH9935114.1 hypothetical protein BXZ73DRAFT_76825 [Epithele typhae]
MAGPEEQTPRPPAARPLQQLLTPLLRGAPPPRSLLPRATPLRQPLSTPLPLFVFPEPSPKHPRHAFPCHVRPTRAREIRHHLVLPARALDDASVRALWGLDGDQEGVAAGARAAAFRRMCWVHGALCPVADCEERARVLKPRPLAAPKAAGEETSGQVGQARMRLGVAGAGLGHGGRTWHARSRSLLTNPKHHMDCTLREMSIKKYG